MEMLRLYSMDDIQTLEVAKYDVRQPAADDERENALTTGALFHYFLTKINNF
jgi:hypothetical protein